jgi:hypothetical protein
MDWYIDSIDSLLGFIKKHSKIGDIYLFKDKGEGLRGMLDPGSILQGGPQLRGRDMGMSLTLMAPYDQWKALIKKMGIIEDALNRCNYADPAQKINYRVVVGDWERVEDESNLSWTLSMALQVVRLEGRPV